MKAARSLAADVWGTILRPPDGKDLRDHEPLQLRGELRWHPGLDKGPVRAVFRPRYLTGRVRPRHEVAPAVGDADPEDPVPLRQSLFDRRSEFVNALAGLRGHEHRTPLPQLERLERDRVGVVDLVDHDELGHVVRTDLG